MERNLFSNVVDFLAIEGGDIHNKQEISPSFNFKNTNFEFDKLILDRSNLNSIDAQL